MEGAYRISMEAVLADDGVDALISIMLLTKDAQTSSLDFVSRLTAEHPQPLLVCLSATSSLATRPGVSWKSVPYQRIRP